MAKEKPEKGKRGRGIAAAPAAAVSGWLEGARNFRSRNAAGREWLSLEAGCGCSAGARWKTLEKGALAWGVGAHGGALTQLPSDILPANGRHFLLPEESIYTKPV